MELFSPKTSLIIVTAFYGPIILWIICMILSDFFRMFKCPECGKLNFAKKKRFQFILKGEVFGHAVQCTQCKKRFDTEDYLII